MNAEKLKKYAEEYTGEFESHIEYASPHYFRKTLYRDEDIEVVLVCFSDKQSTSVHDHCGSDCAVRVVEGEVNEARFVLDPHGNLFPCGQRRMFQGGTYLVDPFLHHQVVNLKKSGTVLLNFYSPPLPPLK